VLRQEWWRTATAGAAILSALIFVLCWNGRLQSLDNQGGIGVLIDMAILTGLLVWEWPG
jgi:hypothetical protein